MLDIRNTPVSYSDTGALEAFESALGSFQNYFGDPMAQAKTIIEAHPEFLLAHLFRAIGFYLSSERRHLATAQESVSHARALLDEANPREQQLYAAVEHLVAGDWAQASLDFDTVLHDFPRDVLALQTGHLLDFFRGDALNLRNRPGRILNEWDPSTPGYSYVMGMYAFGLEESNQYALAEDYARRALEIEPRDPWSVHAVVHVLEMMGRAKEGIEFLEMRHDDWAPENGFAFHNWWHLGLMYLETENDERVLQLVDDHIFADVDDSLVMLDVSAMLWRLHLLGVDVEARCERAARIWEQKLEEEAGYYAFNDFHAAVAFAAARRGDLLAQLEARLSEVLANTSPAEHAPYDAQYNIAMTEHVGLPLVQAMRAYSEDRYAQAAAIFRQVRDGANRFGGSHAQRDLLNVTLLSAAAKQNDQGLVRHLLNERAMFKPEGILGKRVVAAA